MIVLLALLALLAALLYRHVVQPLFLSPLSRMPAAHWSCHVSSLWIYYTRWSRRELRSVHDAHRRLGPVVRLAPNEVSVNCVKGGISTVYAGGWEKSGWYEFFSNYGVPPMFATPSSKPHSNRKRMISNIYSKSTIQSSPSLRAATAVILHERLLPLLSSMTADDKQPEPTNIYALFSSLTMDFVTAHIFGLASGTNFVQNPELRDSFLHWYYCRHGYSFWPQEFPNFTGWLNRTLGVRLVPKFVDGANGKIESMTWNMCEKAEAILNQQDDGAADEEKGIAARKPENYPSVYAQLRTALKKDYSKKSDSDVDVTAQRTQIASEVLDHLAAGFDTSGITLVYLAHELSQRPALQSALRTELRSLTPPVTPASAPNIPSAKDLDALPLLQAIVLETLRLHAAIPGLQPRVSPAGAALGPPGQEYTGLPTNLRVACQAWSLHRNEAVFSDAEKWQPERWLDGKGGLLTAESDEGGERFREMMRWFWAFGSGGRMCIGSHLALYPRITLDEDLLLRTTEMKFIVAAIYSNYETDIVNDDGIEQSDAYTAPPVSNEALIVTFKRAS